MQMCPLQKSTVFPARTQSALIRQLFHEMSSQSESGFSHGEPLKGR